MHGMLAAAKLGPGFCVLVIPVLANGIVPTVAASNALGRELQGKTVVCIIVPQAMSPATPLLVEWRGIES